MLLIHLSDIHFRHGEVGVPLDPNTHLRNELLIDAEKMCSKLDKTPSAILISGDIAYAGHTEEYTYALSWLEELADKCGTTTANIFIVPGNHDVVRSIAGKPMVKALHDQIKVADHLFLDTNIRGYLNDQDTGRALYESLDNYNLFAQQFFCDLKPPLRTLAKRDLMLNDGSILRLNGINSSFVSSASDKAGDIFVDPSYVQITREQGVEHLVLCHHPISWIRQGNVLSDHLNDVARIQLFGHDHTNRIDLKRDSVIVAASAAHPDRTEHGWEPGYNLIELNVDNSENSRKLRVSVHVRIWQNRPAQFIPKMDRDKDVFINEIVLEAWSGIKRQPSVVTGTNIVNAKLSTAPESEPIGSGSDPMDNLRNISVRFFKLKFSQKSAIAGKLDLLENEDVNQPDFERFRSVFNRAHDRGLIEELDKEVRAAEESIKK
ncbi:MAG: metallophosphoesterase [Methylotenera sp.]